MCVSGCLIHVCITSSIARRFVGSPLCPPVQPFRQTCTGYLGDGYLGESYLGEGYWVRVSRVSMRAAEEEDDIPDRFGTSFGVGAFVEIHETHLISSSLNASLPPVPSFIRLRPFVHLVVRPSVSLSVRLSMCQSSCK